MERDNKKILYVESEKYSLKFLRKTSRKEIVSIAGAVVGFDLREETFLRPCLPQESNE
ncbi:MAG: hypothetical protein ACFFAN_16650 [Promethearchaeota archaeon]